MHQTVEESIQNLKAIEPEQVNENGYDKDTLSVQINASDPFQQRVLMGHTE